MKSIQTLLLVRSYGPQGTNGKLSYLGEHICYTIELPDRNNLRRISCIPEGRYLLRMGNYPKFGLQIGLPQVLNREAILIHPANDALKELLGCIAPVTTLTGEGKGSGSGKALAKLKKLVYALWKRGDTVFLQIHADDFNHGKVHSKVA